MGFCMKYNKEAKSLTFRRGSEVSQVIMPLNVAVPFTFSYLGNMFTFWGVLKPNKEQKLKMCKKTATVNQFMPIESNAGNQARKIVHPCSNALEFPVGLKQQALKLKLNTRTSLSLNPYANRSRSNTEARNLHLYVYIVWICVFIYIYTHRYVYRCNHIYIYAYIT